MASIKSELIDETIPDEGEEVGHDEVDFVQTPNKLDVCLSCRKFNQTGILICDKLNNNCTNRKVGIFGDTQVKAHEKFHFFHFPRRQKSDPGAYAMGDAKKKRSRFARSASLAKIFGSTYNTKKYEDGSALLKLQTIKKNFLNLEKFHKKPESNQSQNQTEEVDEIKINDEDYIYEHEPSAKSFRTLTRGLGKLLRRNCSSVDISAPDPEYKVSYLGNVLTGWAKGDGCVEKPLATLWRNYTQNSKPDVMMKLCVCPSGLKATTKQHGLTEYWSHRITYCSSPKNYPRVFCWIYRHEGRKLKHEFRCHAVICSKDSIAKEISETLKENLAKALLEFKRDKINKQNARLSLANSVYDNPSMPRRKIMLSVGANNYRPPLERSKSAPKLMAIEELVSEEEEEGAVVSPVLRPKPLVEEMRPCCLEDSLFPSTTLGRRRCRRGHSIRRSRQRTSFRSSKLAEEKLPLNNENLVEENPMNLSIDSNLDQIHKSDMICPDEIDDVTKQTNNSSSSEDDFESFLMNHNYNSKEPLSSELISYFDLQMNPKTISLQDLCQISSNDDEMNTRLALSLDHLNDHNIIGHEDDDDDVFFDQKEVLDMLMAAQEVSNKRLSGNFKTEMMCMLNDDGSNAVSDVPPSLLCNKIGGGNDSDEGSISSGCETSSTVTSSTDDSTIMIKSISVLERVRSFEQLLGSQNHVINEPIGEKPNVFQRSITFPTPGIKSTFMLPPVSRQDSITNEINIPTSAVNKKLIKHLENIDSDSELSDESGYVEFQENQSSLKSVLA